MKKDILKWVILGLLTLGVVIATALANRNVYTKPEINRIEIDIREDHDRDIEHVSEQLQRIEVQTTKLVDHLIEEGSGDGSD